ncbi:cation channel family protein (macronuclear) [Tetrahymena thermophila SB210]|uniref:Cation channel family protein n=1 Tax=Tetrahymena thermophila (strain SB210) TaxID=312017 RepID=W7X5H5_TETTS|nr:cation channel family protein [Tetrahymena thermophila SB210]EWS72647.1 cation channel family protein [Tetrahymena thermophila SB210]|eukprot:XP_012654815.1 cation channel family protein [Tetrahymena thermophila SB210]
MTEQKGIIDLSNKKLNSINEIFIKDKTQIYHLDLSYNNLKRVNGLESFTNLKTLIIDHNQYSSLIHFPVLQNLDTFSAIANQFNDLNEFLILCVSKFPKLTNLSIQKNPMVPSLINAKEYFSYRSKVLQERPEIQILDSMPLEPVDMTIFDNIPQQSEQEEEPKTIQKARLILPDSNGIVECDPRYAIDKKKKFSSRSEGNRFLKNKDL